MRRKLFDSPTVIAATAVLCAACSSDSATTEPGPPAPPPVLVDSGRVSLALASVPSGASAVLLQITGPRVAGVLPGSGSVFVSMLGPDRWAVLATGPLPAGREVAVVEYRDRRLLQASEAAVVEVRGGRGTGYESLPTNAVVLRLAPR